MSLSHGWKNGALERFNGLLESKGKLHAEMAVIDLRVARLIKKRDRLANDLAMVNTEIAACVEYGATE